MHIRRDGPVIGDSMPAFNEMVANNIVFIAARKAGCNIKKGHEERIKGQLFWSNGPCHDLLSFVKRGFVAKIEFG